MSKGNIVVVEACSTGYNYIEDIIKRGYEPIVLETRIGDPETEEFFKDYRKRCYALFPREVTVLPAGKNYEEDLERVRAYNPVLVLTGEDHGVDLSTHLADDLGLPGNPYKHIGRYIRKSEMHKALAEYGIRSIRGVLTDSLEEAVAFIEELGHERVVVKPTFGAGSQGMKLCESVDEMRTAFNALKGNTNYFGDEICEVLVQERIYGKEYIVNTMSRNGMHKVTTMWSYERVQTASGGSVYDKIETVNALEAGHTELIEYVYKTLDAIGIVDGPVHGEYMIDKNGPVLIEVNCRPLGLAMPAEYLDLVSGQHETDTFLDAMLDLKAFEKHLHDPYRMLRKGIVKLFISPKKVMVEAQPVRVLLNHMRSIYKARIEEQSEIYYLEKTEDMEGNAGIVFMVHDNPDIVRMEADYLHRIESQFFRMLYHGVSYNKPVYSDDYPTLKEVIDMLHCEGSTLVISEEDEAKELDVVVEDTNSFKDAMGGFDQVIVDFPYYGEGQKVEETVENIFLAMYKVKDGGRFIVPKRFYQMIPYGKGMIEALMTIVGFTIEAPTYGMHDIVFGRRGYTGRVK